MSVSQNYLRVKEEIHTLAEKLGRNPQEITLIAVTKGYSLPHVLPAYDGGCRDFGENRVQEALPKLDEAPQDLRWHLIGSLQKNKVRKIMGKFSLIHSVDSFELAQKISECSQKMKTTTEILLQANTSGETAKHGLSPNIWHQTFEHVLALPSIKISGLMTMAPLLADEKAARECFSSLRKLRDELQRAAGTAATLAHLSMGMSADYPYAIAEGATLLRIGTAIFKVLP